MALVLKDRVKETTTTQGTGTYTLAGAVAGFEAFSEIGDGNTTYYCCTDGTDFEVGVGTYTASGTRLARTTILQSSSGTNFGQAAAVSWGSGTRDIFCTQPAQKAVFLDDSNKLDLNGNAIEMGGGFINLDADGNSSISASTNDVIRFTINGTGEYVLGVDQLRPFGNEQCQLGSTSRRWSGLFSTNGDFTGDVDVDGTLSLNGTAITETATLSTGISNNNVPKFTSGVSDNDFLRVDGTAIEGRGASQVVTDIGAMPLTGGTFTGDVTLEDASSTGSTGPTIDLYRNSPSPAVNDAIGEILFSGEDDGGNKTTYARINAEIEDETNGTEDGRLEFKVVSNGNLESRIELGNALPTRILNRDLYLGTGVDLQFEGASAGGTQTTLTVVDPTSANTITLPDASGTVALQNQSINAQTGTTYTTVLSDAAQLVTLNNASAITLTIPPNSSVAYAVGTRIDFIQIGAGQVTVAGGTGVTVNATPTLKFRAQHSAASCIKIATNTWQLVGDLAES